MRRELRHSGPLTCLLSTNHHVYAVRSFYPLFLVTTLVDVITVSLSVLLGYRREAPQVQRPRISQLIRGSVVAKLICGPLVYEVGV